MCKLINKIKNKIMAQFTINHNGLPPVTAITEVINIPVDFDINEDLVLNVLSNDLLGVGPTVIIDVTPVDFSLGTLEISEDGLSILLKAPWNDPYESLPPLMGTHSFEYTIKDSFDRESTVESSIFA